MGLDVAAIVRPTMRIQCSGHPGVLVTLYRPSARVLGAWRGIQFPSLHVEVSVNFSLEIRQTSCFFDEGIFPPSQAASSRMEGCRGAANIHMRRGCGSGIRQRRQRNMANELEIIEILGNQDQVWTPLHAHNILYTQPRRLGLGIPGAPKCR